MDLPTGRSATTLITSILELARTLGLDVVAEGVETEGSAGRWPTWTAHRRRATCSPARSPAARCTEALLTSRVSAPAR